MVRPNQVIRSTEDTLTFIMFARSEQQVIRRVVTLNFPGIAIRSRLQGKPLTDFVRDVTLATEGMVNRYQVTVDLEEISNGK